MTGELTAELLRSRMSYDPDAGVFTWLPHPGKANGHRAWDKQWAGKPALVRPTKSPSGGGTYALIRLLGKHYGVHRLVWLYVHGRWPTEEIDHIDGDPLNNRLTNLREATHAQNQMNKGPMRNNVSGFKGVNYRKGPGRYQRYVAQIKIPGGTVKHIGSFKTAEEASAAYEAFAQQLHGSFFHQK